MREDKEIAKQNKAKIAECTAEIKQLKKYIKDELGTCKVDSSDVRGAAKRYFKAKKAYDKKANEKKLATLGECETEVEACAERLLLTEGRVRELLVSVASNYGVIAELTAEKSEKKADNVTKELETYVAGVNAQIEKLKNIGDATELVNNVADKMAQREADAIAEAEALAAAEAAAIAEAEAAALAAEEEARLAAEEEARLAVYNSFGVEKINL